MNFVLIVLIGVFGGVVSGLLGVGGGLIFVPLLMYVLHFKIHMAIGTSLAIVVPTALIGALRHGMLQHIDWRTALIVSLFTVIGSWLGATLTARLDPLLLKRIFAGFLVLVAFKMFFQN